MLEDEQKAMQEQAGRVQRLLLEDFEEILTPDNKGKRNLTSMDRATIARFLKENNFRVDANDKAKDLKQIVEDVHARRRNGTPRIMPDPAVLDVDT
jgi:hypothetical protein